MSAHPLCAWSPRTASAVRRTARIAAFAAALAVAAAPAAASAAPRHHRPGHVHAARCALRHTQGTHHRAACRSQRRRNTATTGIATPGVATITSGPAAGSVTTSTNVSFSFARTGSGPFRCSLDGAPFTLCSSPTALHGLTVGTHTFSVYAFNDSLVGPTASIAWSVVASPSAPPAPGGLAAVAGDAQVSLSWNASTSAAGIAGYRVFRNGTQIAQVATTSYLDSGLVDGTAYSYAVQAIDGSGAASPSSATVSATPQAAAVTPPPPPAPAPPPSPSASMLTTVTSAMLTGTPWQQGSVQCAPGTPSKSPRLRGTVAFDQSNQAIPGVPSLLFTLPADTNTTTYPLEACDLHTAPKPVALGTGGYYGMMVYVPRGWTIPNTSFNGVEIAEYHFQNVYGAPVSLQLHPDHVTLALETGACSNHATATPGCAIRSNADARCRSRSGYTCLAGQYAIPPGALVQGQWNEIVMHATWTTSYTGDVETWYRTAGASAWTQSANVSGIPTVQYDVAVGTPPAYCSDLAEAYSSALHAPMSLSLGGIATATTFASAAASMP